MSRKCRCCNQNAPLRIVYKDKENSIVKIIERQVKCGFCGDSVNQLGTNSKYGKWFHVQCFREFTNFYKNLFKIDAVKEREDLQLFRDHVLLEMIMRNDLRLLKTQWSLLVANKAVPIQLRHEIPQLIAN